MARLEVLLLATLVLGFGAPSSASDRTGLRTDLERHFLSARPTCAHAQPRPILLVADLTLTGEIDDSVSLYMYSILEDLGCVHVLAVVSIFGNGGSTTAVVHRNLQMRLGDLSRRPWPLLRGPDESYRKVRNERAGRPSAQRHGRPADLGRLRRIAATVNEAAGRVVIVELGPATVSARLLSSSMVDPAKIEAVLGVGGREPSERFGSAAGILGRFGSFTDFNVRKDTKAIDFLLRHVPGKLFLVTYRSGVGDRMVPASMIAAAVPALRAHALERQRWLDRMLGYDGIPLWDTWTSAYFIEGRANGLGCRKRRASVRMEPKARWPRLLIDDHRNGPPVMICHRPVPAAPADVTPRRQR